MSSSALRTQVYQALASNTFNADTTTPIYSAGAWDFKNASAVTSVKIDASGNVGIGTASPSTVLDLRRGAGIGVAVTLSANGNAPASGNFELSQAGDNSCYVWNRSNNIIAFGTNNTERMRIDASGYLLVGTTSLFNGDYRIQLSPAAGTGVIVTRATTTSHVPMAFQNSAGTAIGSIACTNSATSFNPSSDRRLKENIESLDNALEVVKKLRPRKYTWKIDGSHDDGFIAQELQEIEEFKHRVAVIGKVEEEEYYGVDYMRFVTYLTAAIQELSAKVEEQSSRIDAQAAEIEALKAK